eukprot:3882701-Rhodomonas_salina.1
MILDRRLQVDSDGRHSLSLGHMPSTLDCEPVRTPDSGALFKFSITVTSIRYALPKSCQCRRSSRKHDMLALRGHEHKHEPSGATLDPTP